MVPLLFYDMRESMDFTMCDEEKSWYYFLFTKMWSTRLSCW